MENPIENLTTSEAAIAAGVTVAKINRMIDKRILPKVLYKTSQKPNSSQRRLPLDRLLFRDGRCVDRRCACQKRCGAG